jgi:hypothetical protein
VRSLIQPLPREQAEQIERWIAAAGPAANDTPNA